MSGKRHTKERLKFIYDPTRIVPGDLNTLLRQWWKVIKSSTRYYASGKRFVTHTLERPRKRSP